MALARFAWALASLEPFAVKWFERPRSMLSRERFRDMVYIDVVYCGNRIDVDVENGERTELINHRAFELTQNNGDAA